MAGPRRRCPVCRSKQWHKEPSSGLIACSEGHVLQNYRNEVADADDPSLHALRKRTLKSGRTKKEKESKADPKRLSDDGGAYSLLLLRKQVIALISFWNLPPEFETICRDIWTTHLSLLPNPPPAEPYFHLLDTQGKPHTTTAKAVIPDAKQARHEEEDLKEPSPSEFSSDDEENEEDPEMAELLRENSASGSSDDDDIVEPTLKPSETTRKAEKQAQLKKDDSPANNVAVLMLACWTMRIPVMCADFRKIIESHELPYLDPVRLLPTNLTLHLTRYTIQMLSPRHAPGTLFVHSLASRLAKIMYSSYGIVTPELNAAPILWRAVRGLGGTPTLYHLTKKLAYVVSPPLTLHYSLAPSLKQVNKRDPDSHKYDNAPPELAFLATCIVVLKMVYGLDGKTRLPNTPSDPACALPRLDEYLALLKNLDTADLKSKHAIFNSDTQMSVADLSGPMTDEYLDFCEKALTGPNDEMTKERNFLANYFPVTMGNSTSQETVVEDASNHPILQANRQKDDGAEAVLPGQSHTIYNARDVLGTLPEEYELVIGRAAGWVGVPDEYLSSVIEKFERRVVHWWDGEKRRLKEVAKED